MITRTLLATIALLLLAVMGSAQVIASLPSTGDDITLADASGNPVTPIPSIPDEAGNPYLTNSLSVDIVVELRQNGVLLVDVGIEAHSSSNQTAHGLGTGTYEIWGYPAGFPGLRQLYGYLVVP